MCILQRKLLPCMSTELDVVRSGNIICIKNWNGSSTLIFYRCMLKLVLVLLAESWVLSSEKQSGTGWVYLRHLWKTLIRYPYKRAAIQHWWCLFRRPHDEHTHIRYVAWKMAHGSRGFVCWFFFFSFICITRCPMMWFRWMQIEKWNRRQCTRLSPHFEHACG